VVIVRYADDIVVGFERETDARRFSDAMRDRLQEFSLSLHREKTRLIEFGRHAAARRAQRGVGKPETLNFQGFNLKKSHSPRKLGPTRFGPRAGARPGHAMMKANCGAAKSVSVDWAGVCLSL